jgi:hypothetical protein
MNEVDKARKKRNDAICKEWVAAQERMMRGEKASNIMTEIGSHHGISMQNVIYILKNAGLYSGAKKTEE